ncbi:MAG TPA: hypothetical protein VFQ39_17125, partial [Longimicrobium sp.]|nr:hypothetical protein [Longimicrobium sp.]
MTKPVLRAALAAGALLLALPAAAQRGVEAPPRPALWAGADTNSARVYYGHGLTRLETRPDEAAAAFYWAARLDPGSAEALYAHRVSLLLSDPHRLMGYMDRDRRVLRRPEVMALDSLQLRALAINPFLNLSLDRLLLRNYLRAVLWEVTRSPEVASYDLVDQMMSGRNPGFRASLAAAEGRFPEAIREYGKQLR